MKAKVNDKVVVKDFQGKEWNGVVVNVSDYREPDLKYAIALDDYTDDYVFVGDKQIVKIKENNNG